MVEGIHLKKQKTDIRGTNAGLHGDETLDIHDSIRSSAVRHPEASVSLDNSSDAKYL